MKRKNYAGKYYLWQNGLRFKVLDQPDEYGDWRVQGVNGNSWTIRPQKLDCEITKAQFEKKFVEVRQEVIRAVVCGTCCAWKCGKEELSIKVRPLTLPFKRLPSDDQDRMQTALRAFFRKYKGDVTPYIYSSEDHIEHVFIANVGPPEDKEGRDATVAHGG